MQYPNKHIHCIKVNFPPNKELFIVIIIAPIHIIINIIEKTSPEFFLNKTSLGVLDRPEAGLSLNQYLENRITNRASWKGAHRKGYEFRELFPIGFACKFHSINGSY